MPRRRAPIGVLLSGGVDSAVLLCRLCASGTPVTPLYVRCGLRWEAAELHWLRRLLSALRAPSLRPLRVIDLPLRSVYGSHWSLTGRDVPGARTPDRAVYLPGRNAVLLSAAAIACVPQRVSTFALGTLKGNPFGDATPQFLRALSQALSQALGRSVRFTTPLARLSKVQVIRRAARAPLALTFSCLTPRRGYRHCGRCNKCAERRQAFRLARVDDPTSYA